MRALACEQRPAPPNTGAVEGRAVGMFAVLILGITAPDRAVGRLYLEQGIYGLHCVHNTGVIRSTQPKTHQGERLGANDGGCLPQVLRGWTIFNGDEALVRRRGLSLFRWRDAHIVACDTELAV